MSQLTHVGMDVHKESISVAMLLPRRKEPLEWKVRNEPQAIRRMSRKLLKEGKGKVLCCYEAGPTGFVLKRQLEKAGIGCQVIVPTLIPKKPGDRVKTDRRDAKKLAELFRAGMLTEVHPPTEEQEAVRDLCRCREDIRRDLTRCRHRLSKFLLRRGEVFREAKAWSLKHRQWLRKLSFDRVADQMAFQEHHLMVLHLEERLKAMDEKLSEVAQADPTYQEIVGHLRCFRGIDTITALVFVSELGDIRRFQSPRQLMGYLGVVPSERSTGEKRNQGHITKTGNGRVRRLLIESAWHYRHKPAVGATLRRRREGQPTRVIAIADRAMNRLSRRFWRLTLRNGKSSKVATVAIARELLGYLWQVMTDAADMKQAA